MHLTIFNSQGYKMKYHLLVVPIIAILLMPTAATASAAVVAKPATSALTTAQVSAKAATVAKQKQKQKKIAHIKAHIVRLEDLVTVLTSKSETLRLAKAARVKATVTKLQTKLAHLQSK
jgi:hypothetical protein